jgi:transcriptional regulator with XRE-family HTH domain
MKPALSTITHAVSALSREIAISQATSIAIADAVGRLATGSGSPRPDQPATVPADRDEDYLVGPAIGGGAFAAMAATLVTDQDAAHAAKVPDLDEVPDELDVVAEADEDGTAAANEGTGVKPRRSPTSRFTTDQALTLNVIGPRLIAARQINGLGQLELSQALGYVGGSHLNQIERGRRTPSLSFIVRASEALAVSTDFLLGVRDEHEHDPGLARRVALQRQVRGQLDTVVAALVTTFEQRSAIHSPGAIEQLVQVAGDAVTAVDKFVAAQGADFDDMPAGASLLHAIRQLRDVVETAQTSIKRNDQFEVQLQATLKRGRFS